MRRYESIIIIDPDVSGEEQIPITERINGLIDQQNGLLVVKDEWGLKKLAYDIKKKNRGHYIRFDYCGTGALVNELERFCRIDDRILKYMTVLIDDEVDIEQVKKEMIEAQSSDDYQAPEKAEPAEQEKQPDDVESASEAPQPDLNEAEIKEPLSDKQEEEPNE